MLAIIIIIIINWRILQAVDKFSCSIEKEGNIICAMLFSGTGHNIPEVYLHIQQGSEFCTQRCTMALTGIWHSGQGGIGKRNGKKRERGGKFLASRQGEGEKCRRSVTGLLALARGGLLCFAGPVPSPSFFCPVTSFISFPSLPPSFLPLNPCIFIFPFRIQERVTSDRGAHNNNLISKAATGWSAKNRFRQISYSSSSSHLYQIRFHSLQFAFPVSPDCGLSKEELSFIIKSHRGRR